jgi:hypothetical protein
VQITIGKLVSLAIAITYVAIGAVSEIAAEHRVTPAVLMLCGVLLIPLAMIWFPDELGSFTGYVGRGGRIDNETPAPLVSVLGWFFLVGLPLLFYLLWS